MSVDGDRFPAADTELLVLRESAKLIAASPHPADAIDGMLRLLSQLVGLNRGRVLLYDSARDELRIAHSYGLTESEQARGVYALGEGVTGRVFETRRTALIQDIDDEPVYVGKTVDRHTLPDETVAYIALPILRQDDRAMGVLAVHRLRKRDRPFERDLALLRVISTFISQVLRLDEYLRAETERLVDENQSLREALRGQGSAYGILGNSEGLCHAVGQALRVADTATTVLLQGESGTGKEKFARMLHLASGRRDGPFVSINCAAIPENLIESELFGYEKGSFTGATQAKKGKVELASGGTLFLDEIGDLDIDLQAKLLRVLEEQRIQRIGGIAEVPVDVRVIAATHKDLQGSVNAGRFRLDLFYRLNVFPIRLPALRERPEDIPTLARHFLSHANEEFASSQVFGSGAIETLQGYAWPGNIRQLDNVIKRVVLTAPNGVITRGVLDQVLEHESRVNVADAGAGESPVPSPAPTPSRSPVDMPVRPYARVQEGEVDSIREALDANGGNKTRAALSLGLTPRQLRYRMSKLGID